MNRTDKGFERYFADLNGLNASEAKKAIKALTDDEFDALVAGMPVVKTAVKVDKLVKPQVTTIIGKIVEISPLHGANEGSTAVVVSTASGESVAFVVTNKQLGDQVNKGFGLTLNKVAQFTIEKRIADTTQFVDKDTDMVTFHTKTGNGFVSASAIAHTEYLIGQLARVSADKASAMATILLGMEDLERKYAHREPALVEE